MWLLHQLVFLHVSLVEPTFSFNVGCVMKNSFCEESLYYVDVYDLILNDFIQTMASGRAVMLGRFSTKRVRSDYVNGLLREVEVLLKEALSGSTAYGYAGHWKRWLAFCAEHELVPISAEVDQICAYSVHLPLSETPCRLPFRQGQP